MPLRNFFLSGLILIVAISIVHFQVAGRYGLIASSVAMLLLGLVTTFFFNQSASHKQNSKSFIFILLLSSCLLLAIYLINRLSDNASLLTAVVYTSSFLLPSIIFKNWQLYWMAFQPAEIGSWFLPVPYVKSNAISLHLNSIPFVIRVATTTNSKEQDYPLTAPGIKTLGMVFSELICEGNNSGQPDNFSDIRGNQDAWIFYTRQLGGLNNRQLDANLSLLDNRVKMNDVVTAQRQ